MKEASKAMNRRSVAEYGKYFKGTGIDIGCGPDSVWNWSWKFTKMRSCRDWDLEDGDGQYLASVSDCTFNWVHSSHSLEHMRSWDVALENWMRVLAKGGYVICTVPSWELYEHRTWPSRFNGDHKWAFSLVESGGPVVQLSEEVLSRFGRVVLLQEITAGFDYSLSKDIDQTHGPAECCIEFILRK